MGLKHWIPLLILIVAVGIGAVAMNSSSTASFHDTAPNVYQISAGGFSLILPDDWMISSASANPWGLEYYVGPAPLTDGMNSYVLVADVSLHDTPAEIERLRQQWASASVSVSAAQIDERPATHVQITLEDGSILDHYLVENSGSLYSLWFHEADSLSTRHDILNNFRFIES
ncbi:MAG: hypothetical protein IPO91_12195 [Chloroflexi bacterium]|nr:hypothetical protein [Chloroflexota bacterium]